jgi:hypothetical protein
VAELLDGKTGVSPRRCNQTGPATQYQVLLATLCYLSIADALASGLPPADGLRAHVELARISDYIVSNVYDVARGELFGTTMCMQRSLRLLKSWCDTLPIVVQNTEQNFTQDRAVIELHMEHNQVRCLLIQSYGDAETLARNTRRATSTVR